MQKSGVLRTRTPRRWVGRDMVQVLPFSTKQKAPGSGLQRGTRPSTACRQWKFGGKHIPDILVFDALPAFFTN